MRERRCVNREGLNRCEKAGSPAEAFGCAFPRMVGANRVHDAWGRRFSSVGEKLERAGRTNVVEEDAREHLSATTRAKDREVPFLVPLARAITTVAFAGEHSLYLSGANVYLKHCLRGAHESRRTEGPPNLAQLAALVVFLLLGIFAALRFQNEPLLTA